MAKSPQPKPLKTLQIYYDRKFKRKKNGKKISFAKLGRKYGRITAQTALRHYKKADWDYHSLTERQLLNLIDKLKRERG